MPADLDRTPQQLDREARGAAADAVRAYWRLGEILRSIHDRAAWRALGFRSFQHYVEDALSFELRKAYYLMSVRRTLEGQITEERAEEVGWSKLAVVSSAKPEARARLLDVAPERSYRDLAREAKALRDPAQPLPTVAFLVRVPPDALVPIEAALRVMAAVADDRITDDPDDLSAELPGDVSKGAMLELICAEFLSGFPEQVNAMRAQWRAKIAARLQTLVRGLAAKGAVAKGPPTTADGGTAASGGGGK